MGESKNKFDKRYGISKENFSLRLLEVVNWKVCHSIPTTIKAGVHSKKRVHPVPCLPTDTNSRSDWVRVAGVRFIPTPGFNA